MGLLRDLGAAATVGIVATTKHKDAETDYEQRQDRYNSRVERFGRTVANSCTRFEELEQAWNDAKTSVTSGSGALKVDPRGNLSWGWFEPSDLPDDPCVAPDAAKTVSGSIPGIVSFIGAPAVTWTLVGLFGTAGTGVAINTLSGAAFTTASAAWLGRMGIAGITGLGVRAAPAVLGGVGLIVSLPVQIAVGAKVAGNRERKAINQIDATSRIMRIRTSFMDSVGIKFEELGNEARQLNFQLLQTTAEFLANLNVHGQGSNQAKDSVASLLQLLVQAQELCARMKQTMEETERFFSENPFLTFD